MVLSACNEEATYPDGGYAYPSHIADPDTNYYYYPLKFKSKRDSFYFAFEYQLFKLFKEPNLSIIPLSSETFRFTFEDAWGETIMISLTGEQISVKKGNPYSVYQDVDSNLSQKELDHYYMLRKWFPLADTVGRNSKVKFLFDSMTKQYPQLLDVTYYQNLRRKRRVLVSDTFEYTVQNIRITKSQKINFLKTLNGSGFWSMPFKKDCVAQPMDGYSFILEANTKQKYQVVMAVACPDDQSTFTQACQKLVELAKLQNEIKLIWDSEVEILDVPEFVDSLR